MAYITSVETQSVVAGECAIPPIASIEAWPSLDPQALASFHNTGMHLGEGIQNQLGLYNGIGLKNQIGFMDLIGFKLGVGGEVNVQPKSINATPSFSAASPNGTLFNNWTLNDQPICASWTCSDVNLKTNIKPLENCLDKVLSLRGVSFDWIQEKIPYYASQEGTHQVGLIAQEVEKVVPELVTESKLEDNDIKGVRYGHLTAVLVEAIKEQQEQINTLKQTVEELSTKLAECCS